MGPFFPQPLSTTPGTPKMLLLVLDKNLPSSTQWHALALAERAGERRRLGSQSLCRVCRARIANYKWKGRLSQISLLSAMPPKAWGQVDCHLGTVVGPSSHAFLVPRPSYQSSGGRTRRELYFRLPCAPCPRIVVTACARDMDPLSQGVHRSFRNYRGQPLCERV